jgi:hypothetical protein
LGAVEKATAEAAKHGDRSEHLAALVAEAREMIEQANAVKAERAKAAAEAAAAVKAAAAAAATAERLRVEEELAVVTLRMKRDAPERLRLQQELAMVTLRMQSDARRVQQMHAQLGSSVAPPAAAHAGAEETQCVVCMDAPKDRIVLPCFHLCACGPCAQRLLELDAPCPVCRGPVERMAQVFS